MVGADGAALGVANNTSMTLMDTLLGVDMHASLAAGGVTLYAGQTTLRHQALDLFGRINDLGGI